MITILAGMVAVVAIVVIANVPWLSYVMKNKKKI